jgi:hypothetical protein
MPVQINELVIRANVTKSGDGGKAGSTNTSTGAGNVNTDEIIKECVDIIMEMLNNKNQR